MAAASPSASDGPEPRLRAEQDDAAAWRGRCRPGARDPAPTSTSAGASRPPPTTGTGLPHSEQKRVSAATGAPHVGHSTTDIGFFWFPVATISMLEGPERLAGLPPERADERPVVLIRDLACPVVELELLQRRQSAIALLDEAQPGLLVRTRACPAASSRPGAGRRSGRATKTTHATASRAPRARARISATRRARPRPRRRSVRRAVAARARRATWRPRSRARRSGRRAR